MNWCEDGQAISESSRTLEDEDAHNNAPLYLAARSLGVGAVPGSRATGTRANVAGWGSERGDIWERLFAPSCRCGVGPLCKSPGVVMKRTVTRFPR